MEEEKAQRPYSDMLARFSDGERAVLVFQLNALRASSFTSALLIAIGRADADNLERLRAGFPDLVAAYESWTKGDLAQRARAAGLAL